MKSTKYNHIRQTLVYFLLVYLFFSNICLAQTDESYISVGKTITIESKTLNENRNIFIYTPMGYEQSQEKYPVIYVLDGEGNYFFASAVADFLSRGNNSQIPKSIVVGIPNTDRLRDFSPVKDPNFQTSGGGENFLDFMNNELFPYIDTNYRTHEYRTLFGHSLCGMFAVYTLFERPEMFNSAIAVSPYLQFANEFVLDHIDSIFNENSSFNKHLYITIGNEPDYFKSLDRLENILSEKTRNLTWQIIKLESEDHTSIPLKSFYDGIIEIYSGWQLPNEIAMNGAKSIKDHYTKLEEKYGFTANPSELMINLLGYRLMQDNRLEKAIEVFKYNVELYPKSANVYDSLGEAFENDKQFRKAELNYLKAVEIGNTAHDRNLDIYKTNLERVRNNSRTNEQ